MALAVVTFNAVGTEPTTREALDAITDRAGQRRPTGVSTSMTGDAAIISAYDEATTKSLDSTTWITIILVILILLLVYRSPVSPLIPLVTIALAYVISRGVVAMLGNGVITISGYTNIFLLVILFGAGTDYCLFLISRFREEMADVARCRQGRARDRAHGGRDHRFERGHGGGGALDHGLRRIGAVQHHRPQRGRRRRDRPRGRTHADAGAARRSWATAPSGRARLGT